MSHNETQLPDFVTDYHLLYLDDLRDSGTINMFGAAQELADEFDLSKTQARAVLSYWMGTYSERHGE